MKLFFYLTLGLAHTFSAPPAATAQHHPPQLPSGRSQGFFVTTFSAVSPDSGKRRVVVTYRLPRNFLVFTRDEGGSTGGYTARCDVSFELPDIARDLQNLLDVDFARLRLSHLEA